MQLWNCWYIAGVAKSGNDSNDNAVAGEMTLGAICLVVASFSLIIKIYAFISW